MRRLVVLIWLVMLTKCTPQHIANSIQQCPLYSKHEISVSGHNSTMTLGFNVQNSKPITYNEAQMVLLRAGLPLSFLNWAYVRHGVYFWRMVQRGYWLSAFSYVKPSDFRRNCRHTSSDVKSWSWSEDRIFRSWSWSSLWALWSC